MSGEEKQEEKNEGIVTEVHRESGVLSTKSDYRFGCRSCTRRLFSRLFLSRDFHSNHRALISLLAAA